MDDEWDLDDEAAPASHDTVKLAQALRGAPGSRQTLGQVVSRMSSSDLPRASELSFPLTGPSGGEEEEEEDEEEWVGLRDELVDFFSVQSPSEDGAGLYAAQKDAFERTMATVDCGEALSEGLAQTVRNLVELSIHLLGKCAATETELLNAVARLEERRARHDQLKNSLAERKKEAAAARGDCRRLEKELEASRLRADFAEKQSALYESQSVSLKRELSDATQQLEQVRESFRGLRPKEEEMLARITLRGKGVAQALESQNQQAQMNLAALTAELEALELSPRFSGAYGAGGGASGSASGASGSSMRSSSAVLSNPDEDSAFSDTATPRDEERRRREEEKKRSEAERYQQLVNELVNDNDTLQREYLELLARARGKKTTASVISENDSGENAILRAGKARAESALREALRDKALLEAALVAQIRRKK